MQVCHALEPSEWGDHRYAELGGPLIAPLAGREEAVVAHVPTGPERTLHMLAKWGSRLVEHLSERLDTKNKSRDIGCEGLLHRMAHPHFVKRLP